MSDLLSIEQQRCRSWVDPIGARELSSHVAGRLRRKAQAIKSRGADVLFVTLTYDPAVWGIEDWASSTSSDRDRASERCWDAMTRDRHVHQLMECVSEVWGVDLKGKWWSKREFTKNGFLHHHLLVELPVDRHVQHVAFAVAWGHGPGGMGMGRVQFEKARTVEGVAVYCGKYCTKYGDDPPDWVFDRDHGSLRFTTCSDGWWADLESDLPGSPRPPSSNDIRARERAEDRLHGVRETVGMRLDRMANTVRVRKAGRCEEIPGVTLEDIRASGLYGEKHRVKRRAPFDVY
ncbi:MAG: hypothetical protein WBA74_25540, partial [Cyclobacteriaceae bacterium]